MKSTKVRREDPADAARHCLRELPYRMIVFKGFSRHGVPLYIVAGSAAPPQRAEKALREAHKVHGGVCFFCKRAVKPDGLTIDHAEPSSAGGSQALQNLLIACKPCNLTKGHRPIECFNPEAGREWLSALLLQVQDRLARFGG